LKRPRGFTVLSLLFVFVSVGSIGTAIRLSESDGSIPKILAFVYCLAALVSAMGLWTCRRWAFHAAIIWSITALLRIFNMQFGSDTTYALPLQFFILYALILSTLCVLLLYYVKNVISRVSTETGAKNEA
jgi:hypothetical protein